MSLLERYQTMSAKLDAAIDSALEHEVAEVVKDIILEQAVSAVYSYPATAPAMSSRRKSDGGLGDRGNLSARVEAGHVLIVEDVAPLQGTDYGIALSDVVEHGLGNYRQPGPPPHSFLALQGKALPAAASECRKSEAAHAFQY